MSQLTLHEVAIGYLLAHQGEHLHPDRNLLVARCVDHLQQQGTGVDTAHVVTMQALGEIQSRGNSAYLDLANTTSYAAFVVDPATKRVACFTAADLLRIAREQADQAAARVATKH